jgi:hypothetical protein
MTFSAGKIMGFKAAELHDHWQETSKKKRWFDSCLMVFSLVAILAVLALLGIVREWSAATLAGKSAQLTPPASVTAAFMLVACLGFFLAAGFSFWLSQGRVKRDLAIRALKVADQNMQRALAACWTTPAKARDKLLAQYSAKQEIIRSSAFAQIHEYNYGVVDTNTSGKALPADLLVAPDDRLIPKLSIPPMSGAMPEEIQKWLAISIDRAKTLIKAVHSKEKT